MQIKAGLKYVSLGLTIGSFLIAGAGSAQTAQAWQMVGVNARLDHAVDTSSVKQGQTIQAKLDGSVKTQNGVKLEKGTELVGTVTSVQPSTSGGPSSLTVTFTTAQLKGGKQIPVKVTLLAAFPSTVNNQASFGVEAVPPAPRQVNSEEKVDQASGLLSNVTLHSQVQDQDSGTFAKKDGNLKLAAGTWLQVGVAPMNSDANPGA
ncbi:MAG TPA: hypothetical protein VHX60_18055 [Acidobacteriaceae bacterium]|jgi:hypothetical protein|nr:hypothetical protein [Acidobacteriaceae bacterium]